MLHIAESFAHFFRSSYVDSSFSTAESTSSQNIYDHFNLELVSEDDIFKILRSLKPKSTIGPDLIPAFILKDCASVFAYPLMLIFNLALATQTFPSAWKISRITPVFKRGNINEIGNYRPISIINNFAKVFELILHEHIYNFVEKRIIPQQHGFVKSRSTVTNLFCFTQDLAESIDNGMQTDVVFMDFSRAFDRMDHGILLSKLLNFGFSENFVIFLQSYLTNRIQFVQCHGHRSAEVVATSGVPQGSHLGPLFFIIFINDILSVLNVDCLLYADDMKIYSNIQCLEDCTRLNINLTAISEWCLSNRLPLNISKCKVMTFTKKLTSIIYDYDIGGRRVERCSTFSDLGVIFDQKLSFREHIFKVVSDSFRTLGFVLRNSSDFSNTETIELLYRSFVRARLEYADIVWSPLYSVHIQSLEGIQRRLMKYICFRQDGIYPPVGTPNQILLSRLGFDSLDARRLKHMIIFLYKIIHGQIDCQEILHSLSFKLPRHNARHQLTFVLPTPRTNVLKHAPLYQLCDGYNKIQNLIDIFNCSLSSIKRL